MTKTYGYVRVSSRDQNEERQLIALRECGVDEKLIIIDKQSGKDLDRPGYRWISEWCGNPYLWTGRCWRRRLYERNWCINGLYQSEEPKRITPRIDL